MELTGMHHLSKDLIYMNQSAGSTVALNPAVVQLRTLILYLTTTATFALAGLCFVWYAQTDRVALLLLGWVTFGTAFDFLSHVLGMHMQRYRGFLSWYARTNFSALCFGIPFTVMAGAFVIAEVFPAGISAQIVPHYRELLMVSLLFGSLFMFARYRYLDYGDAVELTLDKTHSYTRKIFVARRVFLALSLLLALIVMADGLGSEWGVWTALFGFSYIATVPLHILHKHLASMLCEAFTLVVLVYGSWLVFVA
jgi:hypothetical protein